MQKAKLLGVRIVLILLVADPRRVRNTFGQLISKFLLMLQLR
ncbi:hypothetical protein HanIR_Chr06g0295351 [Helianthus annuus]|nr:hypothetical protein HanIR_Chr06g0295351 [Helianthus annuus]